MKLKQRFPYIVLSFLSLIVLVALPLIKFFKMQSQRTVLQGLPPSFQTRFTFQIIADGLGSAALILICVWLGVGLNSLLLRIQDSSRRRRTTIGLVFGSLFLCVALPIFGLILTYTIFTPKEAWIQLPPPPETAKSIAGGSSNWVLIETENGNYFSYSISKESQAWKTDKKHDTTLLPEMDESASPKVEAPGNVISMSSFPSYPGSLQNIYYIILEDHTIWYFMERDDGAWAAGLLSVVAIPIILVCLLMLFGMGLASLLRWLADRIWRRPQEIEE